MRTTSFLLAAFLLPTVAGCDHGDQPAPEQTHRFFYDGVEVESIEDIPEPMQELIYEAWEIRGDVMVDSDVVLRSSCSANCEHGSISISGDSCSCDDATGCTATRGDTTVSAPCPTRKASPSSGNQE